MNHKFKRHEKVRILIVPDPEYVEYHTENAANPDNYPEIKKGMLGKVNLILPNGQYHVEIFDSNGESFCYAPFDEDFLESA